jgi:hypothetical protein
MAMVGEITHTTTCKYAKPVTFGTHRAMFLPRRGASARLLSWSARTSPASKIHWISDARSNAVTVMESTRFRYGAEIGHRLGRAGHALMLLRLRFRPRNRDQQYCADPGR